MAVRIHFGDPARYRLRNAAELGLSIFQVSVRRFLKGPRQLSWNWFAEVGTQMLSRQVTAALKMRDVREARRYLDSVVIRSPALSEVDITSVAQEKFRGNWFAGKNGQTGVTVLYFHGGGYSFYPQSYANFIALVTLAARAKTFALDYRLSPEHRFPTQLDDALNAYSWLLSSGADPGNLVFAGDSAGGNLALALLLAARDSKLPLPALLIALSPATDFDTEYPSMVGNQPFDWISRAAVRQWADWFCDPAQRRNPLVSPLWADLRGLPPIYIQAGGSEILYDSIQAFADRAKNQGADVVLDTWEDMNHDFQIFGTKVPQSAEALGRIGEVIDSRLRGQLRTEAVSAADR